MHAPPRHEKLRLHAVHMAPRVPQAWLLVPAWHRPAVSQQPVAQVVAEQGWAVPQERLVTRTMKPTARATKTGVRMEKRG